jgi:RNA polymerase sigma-70 factor (family 1)
VNNQIVQGINEGKKKAYHQVFEMYYKALCSFAYKYIADPSETQDIIQEVFISFWEHKKEFTHINSIRAFLYTSARNKCLNHLKHRLVRQKNEAGLIYELESEQFFTNHVIEEEVFNQLYQEIKSLPDASQKIMLLALKGLKNREIAEKLDISENTVKTQKKIAYAKIKDKMGTAAMGILLSL